MPKRVWSRRSPYELVFYSRVWSCLQPILGLGHARASTVATLGLRTSLFTRIGSLQSLLQPILRLGYGQACLPASLALRIGLYLQESGVCRVYYSQLYGSAMPNIYKLINGLCLNKLAQSCHQLKQHIYNLLFLGRLKF